MRSGGASTKCSIHVLRAIEQLFEALHADRQRDRQTDRRPQRIAATDPFPELEHVFRIDPERDHRLAIGRYRDKVPSDRGLVTKRLEAPGTRRFGVGDGLLGGEGLGRDHEQGGGGIERAKRLGQLGTVDIGDEVHAQSRVLVGAQRLAHHLRPETRTADADAHHIGDALRRYSPASDPARTSSEKVCMRDSTERIPGMTSPPST